MIEEFSYKPRIIDKKIELLLSTFGALCIEGPKWCGKTWTSYQHCRSAIFLSDPTGGFQNRKMADMDPSLVLIGDKPRMIDEWQEVPLIWDAVRFEVDRAQKEGQFILTGSSTPRHKGIMHSGAGRIASIKLRPMTLYETGDSTGVVSLEELCHGEIKPILTGEVSLMQIVRLIVRGGWPQNIGKPDNKAALLPYLYLKSIINDDVHRLDGVQRDTNKMWQLLRSLARNESTTASNATLQKDIKAVDKEDISDNTISVYLNIFRRLFITDNTEPFSPNVRSSLRVKQNEKRHLSDPSVACALLKLTPTKLMQDLNTLGFLFEALVERDLRVYAESFGAEFYHYQDYKGKEIDAVVELDDGQWAAIEIKLGANQIDAAANSLLKLQQEMKEEQGRPPAVLTVICGLSRGAYRRPDGVFVVPITALRP